MPGGFSRPRSVWCSSARERSRWRRSRPMRDAAPIGTLRARFATIDRRLTHIAEGDGADSRDAIKNEIIALFRSVEREIADLSVMKEEIRGLVERWKTLKIDGPAVLAPSLAPSPAAPPRVD